MIAGIQSALSGLQAFATKMASNAHNVANLNTEGFKKDRVVLSTQTPEGVMAVVAKSDTPGPVIAEQTDQGLAMIEQSNVDLGDELPDMMLTGQGYKANLKTLQAADEMMQTVLDLKA